MSNFQIKGLDDELYAELKELAAKEKRSVSQQAVYLFREYLARKGHLNILKPPAQALLDLAGSWEDKKDPRAIVARIKRARKNSRKLEEGL